MGHEPVLSLAALHNRLHIKATLVAITALRIGAGRSSDVIGNDLPVLRDALGAPFIPGASLKGAFRARLEALIRTVQPGQVLDFQQLEDHLRTTINPKQENQSYTSDLERSMAIWKDSTLIDLTFGAPWLAGRIFFKDALVDRSLWFNQFEIRNGVALNRDTETAETGMLYDYEVVPAGMRFNFELSMENATDWQLGMVLLALRPWIAGNVQIGGFRSRGLGHVQLVDLQAVFSEIETADDVLALLGYGRDQQRSLPALDQPDQQMQAWYEAFRQALIDPQGVIAEGANHA